MSVLPETAAISCDERARLRELVEIRDRVQAEGSPMNDDELQRELYHIDRLIEIAEQTAQGSNRAKGKLRELRQGRQQMIESTQEAWITWHGIQARAANAEARLIAGCPQEMQDRVGQLAGLAAEAADRYEKTDKHSPMQQQTHAAWEAREAEQLHQDAVRACIDWDPDK